MYQGQTLTRTNNCNMQSWCTACIHRQSSCRYVRSLFTLSSNGYVLHSHICWLPASSIPDGGCRNHMGVVHCYKILLKCILLMKTTLFMTYCTTNVLQMKHHASLYVEISLTLWHSLSTGQLLQCIDANSIFGLVGLQDFHGPCYIHPISNKSQHFCMK